METPVRKRYRSPDPVSPFTPLQYTDSLSQELKHYLYDQNLLTAKSRKKVCSMLDNISQKTSPGKSNDSNKRKNFRCQAVKEILESEQSYINQLKILIKYFVHPLKEGDILSTNEFTILFGQIEMIYNLNNELLRNLESDLANVGKAFLRLAPFFKLYSVYAFDYNRAQIILQDLTEKNQRFRKFLEQTESRPEVLMKLTSLLIAPIQRVPRYRLLLQQVILYSSPIDDDFKILQDSLKEVKNTASHMDSVVQEQEVTQMIIDLQNSLVDRLPKIVKPSRKIIKEGVLQKMSSSGVTRKRYCVLMSDIFMYCKILENRNKNTIVSNSLQCSCIFPLKKCRISEVFPGTFKVTCQGDGIILCADDIAISKSWINAMKDTIELHIQCRKTIRKGSSKRAPMRNKDIKNFEVDDVLSQSRKKDDYEWVYRCSDLSDSDSEIEENNLCFNIYTRKLFKRKHFDDATDDKGKTTSTLGSQPKKLFRHYFHRSNSIDATMNESYNNNDLNETFDLTTSVETNHLPRNKVDSSIPMDGTRSHQYQDVLYPLRTSTGSTESPTLCCKKADHHLQNVQQATGDCLPLPNLNAATSTYRKRVQFNERMNRITFFPRNSPYHNHLRPKGYCFKAESNNTLTLRQRLINFFSNLF